MTTIKSPFVQLTLAAITLVFIFGTLAMIWPSIIAIFLGVFWLIQSFSVDQEIAMRSWAEIGPLLFGSHGRLGFFAMLS